MYIRTALTASLTALILMVIPLSADYSDAEYQGQVLIENSGDAVSRTVVRLDLNTDAYIDGGMLDASFNNIWFTNAGGNSMAFMPRPGATGQWYFFYPWELPASSSVLSYLYMGGPDMSPPIRYIPGSTGMTTADADSMELGNNFAIEQKGYIDTSYAASKQLVYKHGAFQTYVPSEGVLASVIGTPTTVRPTSHTDTSGHWTNEANAYDNNTGTYATISSAYGYPTGWLVLSRAATTTAAIDMWVSGNDNSIFEAEYYDGSLWHALHSGAPPVFGDWHTYELGDYSVVESVRVRRTAGTINMYLNEVRWTAVDAGVTASVSSGSHTIRTEADGTDLELWVDGVLEDSMALGAVTVPNNANAWAFCTNGSMPYMEYHKLWVGGALQQHIEWENAATFTDLSGNSNDATPSFPAASSDADVSASLLSFTPLAPADAPSGTTEAGGMAGEIPDEPDNLYDEMDIDHLPGAAVVNTLLDAGGIPRTLFWFPLTFIGIVVLALITYRLTKSLMGMGLVAAVALVFASRAGIVPYWVTVPMLIIAVAILVKEKMSPL